MLHNVCVTKKSVYISDKLPAILKYIPIPTQSLK